MADRQIYALTAITNPATTFLVPVQDAAGAAEAKKLTIQNLKEILTGVVSQTAHGFSVGWAIQKNTSGTWVRCQAVTTSNLSYVEAIVSEVVDANTFKIAKAGDTFNVSALTLAANTIYYLDPGASGANYTATAPTTTGQVYKELFKTNAATEATVLNAPGYEITAGGGSGLSFSEDLLGRIIKTGSTTQAADAKINFSTEVAGMAHIRIDALLTGYTTGGGGVIELSADGTTYTTTGYTWNRVKNGSTAGGSAAGNYQFVDWVLAAVGYLRVIVEIYQPNTSNQYPIRITSYGKYGDGSLIEQTGVLIMDAAMTYKGINFYHTGGNISIAAYRIIGYKS